MVLKLRGVHFVFRVESGILVKVWEEDGLAIGRFDVFSGTAIAMSTGTYFIIK